MSNQQWAQNCNDSKSCMDIKVYISTFAVAPKQGKPPKLSINI